LPALQHDAVGDNAVQALLSPCVNLMLHLFLKLDWIHFLSHDANK
jgi:hypothetical protein